nr:hypothetical protein [Methanothrix sp.]
MFRAALATNYAGGACRAERHHPGGDAGISIEGATLHCTHQPCILCAKMMIKSGW